MVRRTARGLFVVVLIGVAIVGFVVLVSLAGLIDAFVPGEFPVASVFIVRSFARSRSLRPSRRSSSCSPITSLPPTPPRWRSAIVPAVVVGIAIVVLSQVFVVLVPRLVGVAALAGSLASAFIALAWLSFTFQALLYGAAWVRVRDESADRARVRRPGGSRSAGRTGRWRRVTARS